ncbi:uncharacterized protein LOC122075453 isoform X2 [Macadamia integrifolia]|uniref:uncharacterized protein LOC122075453 isoform X2 n=1 Tax=Macadamia integrifolia TaxID=60698 RepID=UPI001C4F4495|nr:uncharacterized protein LOC122075453 isoform X2 [Macadamia integrifolia]
MPRPGPRPYECVRRAWHSDRHQPMRGSLIQEIFSEIHSPATKRNKEWQEKLPIVVLRAEEIMYSKANSEAEYMDLNTLWDRVNDAINTIIRRDEGTETGDYLQPCIEAALNLGCIPRRASRSQRHSNPRSYLNPSAQDQPTSANPRVADKTTHEGSLPFQSGNRTNSPQLIPRYSTFTRPITMNSSGLRSKSNSPVTPDSNPTSTHEFPLSSEKFPPTGLNQQPFPIPASPSSNLGRVCPLYYGTPLQSREPQLSFQVQVPQKSDHEMVVGIPCVQSSMEPAPMPLLEYPFSCEAGVNASDRTTQSVFKDKYEKKSPQIECDLYLRLGPPASDRRVENEWPHQVEDVGSSSSREGSKSNDQSPRLGKEFCFLPRDNPDDPLESCSSKLGFEGEGSNAEAFDRKRKTSISNCAGDGNIRKQPKFPSSQFFDRLKKPGL